MHLLCVDMAYARIPQFLIACGVSWLILNGRHRPMEILTQKCRRPDNPVDGAPNNLRILPGRRSPHDHCAGEAAGYTTCILGPWDCRLSRTA